MERSVRRNRPTPRPSYRRRRLGNYFRLVNAISLKARAIHQHVNARIFASPWPSGLRMYVPSSVLCNIALSMEPLLLHLKQYVESVENKSIVWICLNGSFIEPARYETFYQPSVRNKDCIVNTLQKYLLRIFFIAGSKKHGGMGNTGSCLARQRLYIFLFNIIIIIIIKRVYCTEIDKK